MSGLREKVPAWDKEMLWGKRRWIWRVDGVRSFGICEPLEVDDWARRRRRGDSKGSCFLIEDLGRAVTKNGHQNKMHAMALADLLSGQQDFVKESLNEAARTVPLRLPNAFLELCYGKGVSRLHAVIQLLIGSTAPALEQRKLSPLLCLPLRKPLNPLS